MVKHQIRHISFDIIIYPQYKDVATVKHEVIKAAPKGSAYDELKQMIGLDEAKRVIDQALNYSRSSF